MNNLMTTQIDIIFTDSKGYDKSTSSIWKLRTYMVYEGEGL